MVSDGPSLAEEQDIAKKYINKPLEKGDVWFVVSSKWIRKWRAHIRLQDESEALNFDADGGPPGPIDNGDILSHDRLKRTALEEDDYVLIPKELFTHLRNKYGVVSEKHVLERRVIGKKNARNNIEYNVEVFSPLLTIYVPGIGRKEKEFSKELLISDVEKIVKSEFPILEDPIRLLIYCNGEHETVPSTSTVGEEFTNIQEVIVDYKDRHGRWQVEMKAGRENGATGSSSSVSSGGNHYASSTSTATSTYGDKSAYYSRSSSHNRGTSIPPGLRGLNNLGNTCFMNSAIQSLSNVPLLTDFFLNNKDWESQVNRDNPLGMGGEIARSYADLVDNLWSGQTSPFMPRRFKMAVGKFAPQFSGFQQQDAQELMAFLLDGLHEDLNRIREKPYVEVKDSDGRPDEVVARESWTNYLKRNDSVIVDLFHGQLRSELVCPECERVSVTFDPFCYLSLPLPAEESTVTVFLYRCRDPKPTRYSFRAFPDIPYKEFLKRLRKVAELPLKTELILGEPIQHASSAFRVFPPSGELENIERSLNSPLPEHGSYHRGPHTFVAFEVPERSSQDVLVWVDLLQTGQFLQRPFLINLTRPDGGASLSADLKEEMLFTELANRLLPFVSEETRAETKLKLDPIQARKSGQECDENESPTAMDEGGEPNDQLVWSELSEVEKYDVGKMWLNMETRYTSGYKSVELKSVRLKVPLDKSFFEHVDHSSVAEMKSHGRGVQLQNCLDLFTKKETLGERDSWYCNKCKKHQRATKKFDLWKLPRVLVIHLKRFGSAHRVWRNKLNTKVIFPLKGLNVNKWVKNGRHDQKYNLVSVVNHYGSMGGGHYLANALNVKDGCWYNFDDSSVSKISSDQVVTQNAYVLVYVREESEIPRQEEENSMMEVE